MSLDRPNHDAGQERDDRDLPASGAFGVTRLDQPLGSPASPIPSKEAGRDSNHDFEIRLKLSRGQTISQRIVSLQALRFVAAAMVVTYHSGCAATTQPPAFCSTTLISNIGAAGVDIFFVLSGFVITLTGPLAEPRPSGVQFFWRRWSRVAPLFYLLSLPLIAHAFIKGELNTPQTLATFLFWPAAGTQIVTPYLQAGWTLCFEMVFYTTVSLALVGGRLRAHLLVLAAVIVLLAAARLFSGWIPLRFLANPLFVEFAFGVAFARLWPRLRKAPVWLGVVLIALGVAVFAVEAAVGVGDALLVLATLRGTNALLRVGLFGLPGALMVAGACICEQAARGALVRVAAWLGDASYSIYLVQSMTVPTLAAAWTRLHMPGAPILEAAILFGVSIALGAGCYRFIERPVMMDLRRVRIGGVRTAAVAP
jgi:exopolysaccharide production protein ExoZ